jgi:hypothetical protein
MPKYKKTHSEEAEEESRRKKSLRQEEGKVMEAPGGEMAAPSPMAGNLVALLTSPQMAHPANAPLRAQAATELQRRRGNAYVQRVISQSRGTGAATCLKRDERALREESQDIGEMAGDFAARKSRGQPLDSEIRTVAEASFGKDLTGVRIHVDGSANQLARELGVKAFTIGEDIFFQEGSYNPQTRAGAELLGHELTHVVEHGRRGRISFWGGAVHKEITREVASKYIADKEFVSKLEKASAKRDYPGRRLLKAVIPSMVGAIPGLSPLIDKLVAAATSAVVEKTVEELVTPPEELVTPPTEGSERGKFVKKLKRFFKKTIPSMVGKMLSVPIPMVSRVISPLIEKTIEKTEEELVTSLTKGPERGKFVNKVKSIFKEAIPSMVGAIPGLLIGGPVGPLISALGSGILKGLVTPRPEGPEHGEGGMYEKGIGPARAKNEEVQNERLERAIEAYRKWKERGKGGPMPKEVIKNLGDALHIAQDRGAHSEGAKGMGHDDPQYKGKPFKRSPDKREDNKEGYEIARNNTYWLLSYWKNRVLSIEIGSFRLRRKPS